MILGRHAIAPDFHLSDRSKIEMTSLEPDR